MSQTPKTSAPKTLPRKRLLTSPEAAEDQKVQHTEKKQRESMEGKLDLVLANLSALNTKSDMIDGAIKVLRTDILWIKDQIVVLQANYEEAKGEICLLKQQLNRNSFVLMGLPPAEQKGDVFPLLQKFGQLIGQEIQKNDIRTLYTVNYRNGKGCHIVGEFYDLRQKDVIFRCLRERRAQKLKPITVEQLVVDLPDNEFKARTVSIRSKLTPETRALLAEARKLKGTVFEYIWERDGGIMARQKTGLKRYEITSIKQLREIVSTLPLLPSPSASALQM